MKTSTTKTTGHKDIVEARRFIFSQMVALSKGTITVETGLAQAKLAHQLMEGYKVQVRAMEITAHSSIDPKDVKNVTKLLEK